MLKCNTGNALLSILGIAYQSCFDVLILFESLSNGLQAEGLLDADGQRGAVTTDHCARETRVAVDA